jgi:hypothetical protein
MCLYRLLSNSEERNAKAKVGIHEPMQKYQGLLSRYKRLDCNPQLLQRPNPQGYHSAGVELGATEGVSC